MKIALKIILIAFLSFWAEQVFPWWSALVCAAFISALIPTTSLRAFGSGFTAIGLLWLVCALIYSMQNDFMLSNRVANLFGVNSSVFIIVLTALVGGIAGGMGALCGNQLRKTVKYKAPYRSRHADF